MGKGEGKRKELHRGIKKRNGEQKGKIENSELNGEQRGITILAITVVNFFLPLSRMSALSITLSC